MEILSSIQYGRCFNFHNIHIHCHLCCCECKTDCKERCGHSKYIKEKRYCGNYEDTIERNNNIILQEKLINEKYKR